MCGRAGSRVEGPRLFIGRPPPQPRLRPHPHPSPHSEFGPVPLRPTDRLLVEKGRKRAGGGGGGLHVISHKQSQHRVDPLETLRPPRLPMPQQSHTSGRHPHYSCRHGKGNPRHNHPPPPPCRVPPESATVPPTPGRNGHQMTPPPPEKGGGMCNDPNLPFPLQLQCNRRKAFLRHLRRCGLLG